MSAIGPTWRIQVQNSTGQTVAIGGVVVRFRGEKYGTDGSLTFASSTPTTVFSNSGTIANAAYDNGSTQDNTSDKYTAGTFDIAYTSPTSSAGAITVWLQRSADGGTTWGADGQALTVLSQVTFSGAQTTTRVRRLS